jgi:hypothetical protein
MTSAAEQFVVELARSASRRSHRLLRGLSKHDRDDVLSAAILACWEGRDAVGAVDAPALDDWFMDALVKARNDHRKNHRHSHEPIEDELGVPDDVVVTTSAISTQELMLRHFSPDQLKGIAIIENGDTRKVAKRLKWTPYMERAFRAKINKLRELIPDLPHLSAPHITARTRKHKDADSAVTELSTGDHEIGRIDFVPAEGADCPPCWRCKWFEGWSPANYKPTKLADAEVQTAVQATEARKIEIANSVSTGE